MAWNDWVTIVFLFFGCLIAFAGALGVVRMPDFYTRLHPAGTMDTLAQLLILLGLAFQVFDVGNTTTPWLTLGRLLLISAILFVTAPTSTHAITKAAHLEGLKPSGSAESDVDSSLSDTAPTEERTRVDV